MILGAIKTMDGLEALEMMKQGGMVKSGVWIYRMDTVGGIWTKNESCGIWGEAEVFNILANDYVGYIEFKPLTGWERADVDSDERVRAIGSLGIIELYDTEGPNIRRLHGSANYFLTKEKAEEIDFKQTLFRKLQRFSDENGSSKIDWSDGEQRKYFIYYCSINEKLDFYWHYTDKHYGSVYFNSEEIAKQAIELFHDDLIKYFTGDWSEKNE